MKFKEDVYRVPLRRRRSPLRQHRLETGWEAAVLKGDWRSWQGTSWVPWQQRPATPSLALPTC